MPAFGALFRPGDGQARKNARWRGSDAGCLHRDFRHCDGMTSSEPLERSCVRQLREKPLGIVCPARGTKAGRELWRKPSQVSAKSPGVGRTSATPERRMICRTTRT